MTTVARFPRDRARNTVMRECAAIYERARAWGVWTRSPDTRRFWMRMLARLLRKANG